MIAPATISGLIAQGIIAMLLAAEGAVPSWVGIPAGIAGLGIPLGLWLTGRVMLVSDCDKRVASIEKAHDLRTEVMSKRLDAVVTDRDAWRVAHGEEIQARIAAERSAMTLMDQSKLSAQLLDALTQTLGTRREDRSSGSP